jgi:MFS transporter, UMF1 family
MKDFRKFAWISYDMGNSAHALIVTTICFSLYFKEYLFADNTNANSLWGIITAAILFISAFSSPIISAFASQKNNRSLLLTVSTVLCVVPTLLIGVLSTNKIIIVLLYFFSALGYYIALPIYNSYLPNIEKQNLQKTSSVGWGWGYLGGIIVALICLALGLLNYSVKERPDIFKLNFFVAAIFNTILSLPILIYSRKIDKECDGSQKLSRFQISHVWGSILKNNELLKLLLVYWLIGEIATIGIYFFAIYMSEYAGLNAKMILILSLCIQVIGFFSTIASGSFASKYGVKNTIYAIIFIWIFVPFLLFLITLGFSYWIPVIVIGLIVGSYHAIIRAEIAKTLKTTKDDLERGSIWGFFDTAGRFSQILSPLLVTIFLQFTTLKYAVLATIIFPFLALWILSKYNEK